MTRIAIGPIRLRRIALSVWIPGLYALGEPWPVAAPLLTLGMLSAIRAAMTRVELQGDDIVVVNYFRTIRVPRTSLRRAGFARQRWLDQAVPLVLVGDRGSIRATGVSTWARQFRWPDQPFVARTRILTRVERFFEQSPIRFDYRDPLSPTSRDG